MNRPNRSVPRVDYSKNERTMLEMRLNKEHFSDSTSNWTEGDIELFHIMTNSGTAITDIFPNMNLGSELEETYASLRMETWNKNRIEATTQQELDAITNDDVADILMHLNNIVKNKEPEKIVDSFVMKLFNYLPLNRRPLTLNIKPKHHVKVGRKTLTSEADFSIMHRNGHIVEIIEDKTEKNTNMSDNWSEYQILGELMVFAHQSLDILLERGFPIDENEIVTVQAIRIRGTYFTFYKGEASVSYLQAVSRGRLLNSDMMTVTRYPAPRTIEFAAWDFCVPEERILILKTLQHIRQL